MPHDEIDAEDVSGFDLDAVQYHYQPADKRILVRLAGNVKPSAAKTYEKAVAAL